MAVYLQAPWDLIQTTTMLPNPQLGNLRQKQLHVNIRNAIDGSFYSYKKSNVAIYFDGTTTKFLDRYKLSWDFKLQRGKADELRLFIQSYSGFKWRVIDWKENVYRAYLINDPLEFTWVNKSGIHLVRLELEGELLLGVDADPEGEDEEDE